MDARESRAWLGLIGVAQLLPHLLDAQLERDSRMTHFEFTVLSALYIAPDSVLRMSELAEATAATLPRLSHVATRMEKRELIERVPSETDRRATNVCLTTVGRREFIRAIPAHIDLVRSLVIDALTPEQLDSLGEITEAIGERLAKHRG
ncbi:MarR family winged helix-turn-helix transcriptional regulator [Leucobacter albus]|uniref:MarR family winged helix-turn-helix transcriptional regulator n=1 Tax=Leucobacter albus TaxID=272210 RepID=A0ABW3TRV2_9MICO